MILSLSQAWQKNGGEEGLRADFQAPNALDKTREIYTNAVDLSRLKTYFRAKGGGLPLHPMPRRNAARPRARLPRRGTLLSVGAPACTGQPPEQANVARQDLLCVNSTGSSLVAHLVSGFRQRVDNKCTLFVL